MYFESITHTQLVTIGYLALFAVVALITFYVERRNGQGKRALRQAGALAIVGLLIMFLLPPLVGLFTGLVLEKPQESQDVLWGTMTIGLYVLFASFISAIATGLALCLPKKYANT